VKLRRLARRRARRLALIAIGLATVAPASALAHNFPDDDDHDRVADLALTVSRSAVYVQAGDSASFTARIANLGPRNARHVRAAVALTGQVAIAKVDAPGWSCDLTRSMVNCVRRYLRRGTSSEIVVSTLAPPGFAHVAAGAVVASPHTRDWNPRNNADTADISINNPPVVVDDQGQTPFEKPVEIPVLANDFDPDGDPIDYKTIAQPANGSVTCDVFGCVYSPGKGFKGRDSFSYTLADDRGASATGTVTVTVAAPPEEPPPPPPPPPPPDPHEDDSNPGAVVTGPTNVRPGQTGGYTTIVSNGCKVAAENVVVRFTLPAGATVMSAPARSVRKGRILTVRVGTVVAGKPRGVGVRLRFGKNGGSLRTLVAAVHSSNGLLTGDGLVINVR
jgi:uncharacterized repeat protein (TIGR01451 family)